MTTGADGMAESKPLYLGKYEITEMKAPDGMVINKDAHTAELVYAGQEIEITETAASFCNDRQKARISLSKVLEQNKQFGKQNTVSPFAGGTVFFLVFVFVHFLKHFIELLLLCLVLRGNQVIAFGRNVVAAALSQLIE